MNLVKYFLCFNSLFIFLHLFVAEQTSFKGSGPIFVTFLRQHISSRYHIQHVTEGYSGLLMSLKAEEKTGEIKKNKQKQTHFNSKKTSAGPGSLWGVPLLMAG